MHAYTFTPIGYIASCFKERFGIPRQPGLVPEAQADLEILPPFNHPQAFRGLADYSHVWLIFAFHAGVGQPWRPTVRPPRLGGNRRVGVFASRSPFRPNPIGLSLVRLERMELEQGVRLHLSGIDLLDGTPVLDIKPYLPYAESIPDADAAYASDPPGSPRCIIFDPEARAVLEGLPPEQADHLQRLIRGILEQDPRPGYRRGGAEQRGYGMRLLDFDLRWRVEEHAVVVTHLEFCEAGEG